MREKYDVIIVGAGVAGLYAALQFDENINVLVMAKREIRLCNSSLAQGGVASVLDTVNDNFELHIEDTLIAGGRENRLEAVKVLVEEGPTDVRRMIELGAQFDRHDGELHMTLEGGHCRRRIVHHKDSTGEELMRTLFNVVKQKKNVEIVENVQLCYLDEASSGIYATCIYDGEIVTVGGSFLILATGGIGRVYKYTTNSAIATGDGIALARDLGAKIQNLHYVQFHPTAFAAKAGRERFLISEAVRGEGAFLLNGEGKRFMDRYDERLELAPRDVVSRSIILESRRTGSENFFLDITHRPADFIRDRFPMIYERCMHEGIDITKEPIPVFPCQHYLMGGIDVDLNGRTRVDRLYAVGECSHTGVHGKNRLASNSLLEALVFGRRAAEDIIRQSRVKQGLSGSVKPHKTDGAPLPKGLRTMVREVMQQAYFVIPDLDSIEKYSEEISNIKKRLYRYGFEVTPDYCEAKSLAAVAEIIIGEVTQR